MSTRILKINSEIQKYVSEIFREGLQNPKINGLITVVKVDTSADLGVSRIYLSIYGALDAKEVFNEILHSAGYIRKELCHKMDLRKMPYLEFRLDDTYEYGNKIDKLIDKINRERGNNDIQ